MAISITFDLMGAYLFFRSLPAVLLLLPFAGFIASMEWKKCREKEVERLALEFRDGILAMAGALRAGKSAEHAFAEAARELRLLHGKESVMAAEFQQVKIETDSNMPLETAVLKMAARCRVDEIQVFAEVFSVARRTGGELGRILADTAETIGERIRVQEDISALLHGRRLELQIMRITPAFLMAYLQLTTPDYFVPLYTEAAGRVVMLLAFACYLAAWVMGEKILEIRV